MPSLGVQVQWLGTVPEPPVLLVIQYNIYYLSARLVNIYGGLLVVLEEIYAAFNELELWKTLKSPLTFDTCSQVLYPEAVRRSEFQY